VKVGRYTHTATCKLTSGGEIVLPAVVGKRVKEIAAKLPAANIVFEVLPVSPSIAARRDFMVLWKWEEALQVRGFAIRSARGTHSGGLNRGDRMFVWAVHGDELYLLGAIRVKRSGNNWAEGESIYGAFRLIPLKRLKWQLRFQNSDAEALSPKTALALQVRARRCPSPRTVERLEALLSSAAADDEQVSKHIEALEGKRKDVKLTTRERSRSLRVHVLAARGHRCEICAFDFAKRYGEFARFCVEIHHLELVSSADAHGRTTTLEDVIVVCPNCYRALHQSEDPGNWRGFQRRCNLG
jgi:hypothetical protein